MPRYLLLDTETSGLHLYAKRGEPPIPADDPRQPRLAGVTMIPVGEDLQPESEPWSRLIRPEGWEMSPEASAINGLTTERCDAEGVDIRLVLNTYSVAIRQERRVVVAFNAQFDTKMMRGELRRAHMDDLFMITPNICTMRGAQSLGIKKASGKGGFPGLSDVYRYLFGEEVIDAHTSLADTLACLRIFQHLMEVGAAPEPKVHFSSTRKDTAEATLPI